MKSVKFKFEELNVYDVALHFIDYTYTITHKFPDRERYGIISQFNRAATSIALNIAEGSTDTSKQFIRYLQIAEGSLNECVVCSTIAFRLKYISKEVNFELRTQLEQLSKMIYNLKKYLRSKLNTN